MAAVGSGSFLVTADVESGSDYSARFVTADGSGPHGSTSLPRAFILADLEAVPWTGGRVAALYYDQLGSGTLHGQVLDAVPSLVGPSVDTGLETGCCAHIAHRMIRTPDGLLAVSCAGANYPLHARWLVGQDLQTAGSVAVWRAACGMNPQEIRGALNAAPEGDRAVIALFDSCRPSVLLLSDVSQVGSAPVIEERPGMTQLNYDDAAPISTSGRGLAMVALKRSGEVVWLASDGTLAGLTETGDVLATGVDFLDATAAGTGRTAIVMVSASSKCVRIQIREGTCTP